MLSCDVLVAGAGPAGIGAALAAARAGADVLLVERHGCAGGAMSLGLALTPVGFEPFKHWTTDTDPAGWVVQGIPREMHDRVAALGGVVKPVWCPEVYKKVVDDMLAEAGVRVLFHAPVADARMDAERVDGVVLAAKEGALRVQAGVTVDCTGDGDVFARAGAAFDIGRPGDGRPQPMAQSVIFGGVDLPWTVDQPYAQLMEASRGFVSDWVAAAVAAGELPPVMSGYYFPRVVRGRVLLDQVWTRLVHVWGDPTVSQVLSDAEVQARRQLWTVHEWLKRNVPGFERSFISHASAQVWPRESRRLQGMATLDEAMIRANARSDTGIAKGACFIEVRDPSPGATGAPQGLEWDCEETLYDADVEYDIPYGCLVPEAVDGLLVAGRCMSATHVANGSSRMQITSTACGQAAGAAAALSLRSGRGPRDLDVAALREGLRGAGAVV